MNNSNIKRIGTETDYSEIFVLFEEAGFLCIVWRIVGVSYPVPSKESVTTIREVLKGRKPQSAALIFDSTKNTKVEVSPYQMLQIAQPLYDDGILAFSISADNNNSVIRFFTSLMNVVFFSRRGLVHAACNTFQEAVDRVRNEALPKWMASQPSQ